MGKATAISGAIRVGRQVGGVLKGGRYLLQRPSGAVPERLALESKMLLTNKARKVIYIM